MNKLMRLFNVYREAAGDEGDAGGGPADAVVDNANDGGDGPAGDTGDSAPADEPVANYFGSMPDDWRAQAVRAAGFEEGEDFDKRVGQLERVSDMGKMAKSYFDAQDRIRQGRIESGLPEDATDEQLAEYREANGIPAEPTAYELSLEEGLVLGEQDGRIMEEVFNVAHAKNIPTEVMSELTNAMLKGRMAEQEAAQAQDGVDTQTSERMLKEAWGGADFDKNVNMVKGLITQLPESVRDEFMSARMPDGKAIFNSPEVMLAFADWARKINPSATVVPNSNNPMQTMNDEIKALEAQMGTPEWYKDADAQKRYQDLIEAKSNMEK